MGWTDEEKSALPKKYNCVLLIHNATNDQVKNPEFPSDAYIINYTLNGKRITDLCRSAKMVNIFDMYYDKFGNVINSINFGYGRINPKLWGYPAPDKKRRKK